MSERQALSSATQKRRRQRRPELQSEVTLPDGLKGVIDAACADLEKLAEGPAALPAPVAATAAVVCGVLLDLRDMAATPDRQLQLIPRIAEVLRSGHVTAQAVAGDGDAAVAAAKSRLLSTLCTAFLFPFLMDCRVRYMHRGLTSALRAVYPTSLPAELEGALEVVFSRSLVACWDVHDGRPCLFPLDMSQAVRSASAAEVVRHGEQVMQFLNGVDGLSSTLMPYAPAVFHNTFLQVLPLLADALQWSVANAICCGRRQGGGGATAGTATEETDGGVAAASSAAVFGEDLEHIRFCVRVVATYTHRYTDHLAAVWMDGSDASTKLTTEALSRMMEASVFMLSSDIFPKDVLNATGLLVANSLTVRTCDPRLLLAVSDCVYQGAGSLEEVAQRHRRYVTNPALYNLPAAVRTVMQVLCSPDPMSMLLNHGTGGKEGEEEEEGAASRALHNVFGHLSCNGVFALFKGILAHFSSPIRKDPRSMGVLLLPAAATTAAASLVFDRIAPLAHEGSGIVEEPETRFMAIQTVDSVVRYIVSVFSFAVDRFAAAGAREPAGGRSKRAKKEGVATDAGGEPSATPSPPAVAAAATTPLTTEERALLLFYASFCRPSVELSAALDAATRLIMDLWDDGTQQMSGPLYETYDRILRADQLLARFQEIAVAHGVAQEPAVGAGAGSVSTSTVLAGVLEVSNERRGKYHALLSLLSVMPLEEFLRVVGAHYEKRRAVASTSATSPEAATSPFAAVMELARMLLSGASNHKVANVAGDVFAKVTSLAYAAATATGAAAAHYTDMISQALFRALSYGIAQRGYIPVTSNVNESVSISNMVAHFVYPLLKQNRAFLPLLIEGLRGVSDAAGSCGGAFSEARRNQGIVEILARARSSGIDITAYLEPGSPVFAVVQECLQSINWDVRRIALILCVQSSKKVEPIAAWQGTVMEQFLALNMNLGGDTTAGRELGVAFRQWMTRTAESYKNARTALSKLRDGEGKKGGAAEGEAEAFEAYTRVVRGHWSRLVDLLVANYGSSETLAGGFAVERRAAAGALYLQLLTATTSALTLGADGEFYSTLFAPAVVPALVADLSNGWSLLRSLARDLLVLFCRCGPAHAVGPLLGNEAQSAERRQAAYVELTKAPTYRTAEGAVSRYVLLSTQGHMPATTYEPLAGELDRMSALTQELQALQQAKGPGVSVKASRKAIYDWIQANPLHGRLSLCMELLSHACAANRSHGTATAAGGAHAEQSNRLLDCCCHVIRACSSLVGGTNNSTKGAGADGGDAEQDGEEVVDCRGHVYDRESPEAESVMRRVVNNTWLSIRVSTLVIHRVLKLSAVETLALPQVRQVCMDLMEALLLTKHNGVMRCVRGALKAITEALVRCHDPAFYNLPAEMLAYLLGPEGVTSGDFYRMLRRSQGLPHAILAVLEAEDPTVPFLLFPTAMAKLFAVARGLDAETAGKARDTLAVVGDNQETVYESQRSNALNVLKFIFEDKIFADRSLGSLEEAFRLSTEGFNNASWYIRNSSLMLYSAVLQRLVGEHPSTGGAGVNTSLHDIAKHTPRGVAFALRTLRAGAQGSGADGQVPNLALFPILQMLSMLAPDPAHRVSHVVGGDSSSSNSAAPATDAPAAASSTLAWLQALPMGGDTMAMIDAVCRCAVSQHLMIRAASATALTCLVSSEFASLVVARLADAQLAPAPAPPTLNAVHGTLLELLQFHTQYVGTLRRNRRLQRRSGGGDLGAVAAGVTASVAAAILRHGEMLRRGSAVSPTVAATLLTVIHDALYFGAIAAGTSGGDSSVEELVLFAAQVVEETLAVAAGSGYALNADVGHMKEAAALVLVVCTRLLLAPAGTSAAAAEARAAVGRAMAREAATLSLSSGKNNVVSWALDHLHHYCSPTESIVGGSAAFFDPPTTGAAWETAGRAPTTERSVMAVLDAVTEWGSDCRLCERSNEALERVLSNAAGLRTLGCVAWGEVVAHLRCALTQATLLAPSGAPVIGAIGSGDPLRAIGGMSALTNSDAQGVLVRIQARSVGASQLRGEPHPRLIETLSACARPEQPVACREAVVDALEYLLGLLPRAATAAATAAALAANEAARGNAVPLTLILMRLLFDDLTAIREAACGVCTRFLSGKLADGAPCDATRDVASSVLSLTVFLRRLNAAGANVSSSDLAAYLDVDADAEEAEETGPAGNDDDDDDDDGEGDEVLFNKEADNMYIERSLLAFLVGRIAAGTAAAAEEEAPEASAAMPHFVAFDELLAKAETQGICGVTIGGL